MTRRIEIVLLIVVSIFVAFFVCYFTVYQLMVEYVKTGTITRVDLLPGHIGSTMDKSVVSFSDNSTFFFNANQFALLCSFINKTVSITYYDDGCVIKSIMEV